MEYSDFYANSQTLGGAVEVAVTTLCDPPAEVVREYLQRLTLSASALERRDALEVISKTTLPDADLALKVLEKDKEESIRAAARVAALSRTIERGSIDEFKQLCRGLDNDAEGIWIPLQLGYRLQRALVKAEEPRLEVVRSILKDSKSVLVRITAAKT